jgi:hypothetical protein
MADVNLARFTIDGTPAQQVSTGDAKYVALNSQTLDCTLEKVPATGVLSTKYEVFDPNNSLSPLASFDATLLTWVASGLAVQTLADPNDTAQIIMPATGVHSYLIRCTATTSNETWIFERLVAIEDTMFTPAIRKTIPAEVEEFYARGYSDELNKMVGAMASIGGAFGSAGTSDVTPVTDAGGATIDVAAGSGYLRTTNSDTGTLVAITWAAVSGTAIPADTVRYVGVEYNAGSPQVVVQAADDWNGHDEFRLACVVNEGGTLHIVNNPQATMDGIENTYHRLYETEPFQRADRLGGLILGEPANLKVSLTAGELYDGLNEFPIAAIDTNVADTFDQYYRDGVGGFTKVAAQTDYPNTQYDDGTGVLAALGVNKYVAHWFYLEGDGDLVMMYSQGQHNTLAEAEDATPPSTLPDRLVVHAVLAGRIIYRQGDAGATEVESAFSTTFGLTGVTSHLNLTDIGTNTHAQIDTHIASTANPHDTTLDLAYDGGGAGAGRAVTVDNGPVSLEATDTTAGVLRVLQTPTGATLETMVQIRAVNANFSAGSRLLELRTADDDALPLAVHDGSADVFQISRAGSVSLLATDSSVVATAGEHAAGVAWDIAVEPPDGTGSTATIMHLFAQDDAATGTKWGAGARVLKIESDDNDAVPMVINDGAADVISLLRSGAINMAGDHGMATAQLPTRC